MSTEFDLKILLHELINLVPFAPDPLPRRVDEVAGLRRDRIGEFARRAVLDHCHRTNPRPCTQADMEALLDRAW